jgi:hypothetical protein
MVKSYKDLIGIFKGKQATYNMQILNLLFDNGPLTAWQITGKMTTQGKVSLQKKPKPWSKKWTKLLEEDRNFIKKHSTAFFGAKIQVDGITINPNEILDRSCKAVKTGKDWLFLSNYVKNLMETGVINLDLISNRTLLAVIISQFSNKELENFMSKWKISK